MVNRKVYHDDGDGDGDGGGDDFDVMPCRVICLFLNTAPTQRPHNTCTCSCYGCPEGGNCKV